LSERNVEIVRELIAAWNDREPAKGAHLLDPEVEWEPASPAALERSTFRGVAEATAGMEALFETWETFHFEEADVRAAGDEVVWLGHALVKGKGSGVEFRQEFASHVTVRDGRAARIKAYLSWSQALEAAGLGG
jgi:ketosteroid isomerase-like protein